MQHFKLCQRLKLNSKLCVIVLSLNLMYKNIATLFSPFILDTKWKIERIKMIATLFDFI
jgi:hypothetical protein